ncbi:MULTISPECIES: hypothetical protein [Candidatus Fukatsuia]|uniref:Uncharacterized protein n=1 Tax=Candidatus Fukatsuia symbiotica TaxID=1878942 RepID=A0A2U8I7F3_9GAMM|nr:hypothetical protein [Candidatus Fukatsuia symbiotica]AWK14115.1 hypothetical protein CCS41_05900 [Candidatus Fukatsuia symbiotica]
MVTIIRKPSRRKAMYGGNAKYRRHQRRKAEALSREAIENSLDRRGGDHAKIVRAQPRSDVDRAIALATAFPLRQKPQDSMYNRLMPRAWLFSVRGTSRTKKAITVSA